MSRRARSDFYEPFVGLRIWRRGAREAAAPAPPLASQHAPDYVEPVVGWRVWRVVRRRDAYLLASPLINVVWPSHGALEARCHQWIGGRHDEPVPNVRCTCGIYATKLQNLPESVLTQRLLRPLVVGPVYLWGRIVEGENGWRAERAYPKALYVPFVEDAPGPQQLRIVAALAHYGVPVEPVHVSSFSAVAAALAA